MIKFYLKYFLFLLLSIFIATSIVTILYFFNIFSDNTINIIKTIFLVLSIFINSYFIGKKVKNKGYIEGLKFGGIIVFIILLLNLIFINIFNYKTIVYYILILFTSMIGSTIGINKKKDT